MDQILLLKILITLTETAGIIEEKFLKLFLNDEFGGHL